MFLSLEKNIYHCVLNKTMYILDTKKNRFLFFGEEDTKRILCILNKNYITSDELKADSFIIGLQKEGLISLLTSPNKYKVNATTVNNAEAESIVWRVPEVQAPKRNFKMICHSWYYLFKVLLILKYQGLHSLIHNIDYSSKKIKAFKKPHYNRLLSFINALSRTYYYVPGKVKCLEWSAAVVLFALKNGWRFNLVIGIQNKPFMSHAWVEYDSNVILDKQSLNDSLARILTAPFPEDRLNESDKAPSS